MEDMIEYLMYTMSNKRRYELKIDPWEEGTSFALTVEGAPSRRPTRSGFPRVPGAETILSQTLRPVGFYVTYSCTLFRKGDDPRDPLYALF